MSGSAASLAKQAHAAMVLDKASMKVDVDPKDPSPESLTVAGDGGGEQKLLKDSQKKPPQAAAASNRTFHHNDLKYISAFLKNNKTNIIHDQASSEQQGLNTNHNINNNNNNCEYSHDQASSEQQGLNTNHNINNNNNNCEYSHGDKKDCRPSAEECCDDHKYNDNNSNRDNKTNINRGGKSNPSQYYQGRLGNPPCSPLKLHGDARPQQPRRGAASCTMLQENHATAPKFGEWNYLKKAKEYTDIFDKLQQEKKAGLSARVSPAVMPASSPARKPSQGSTTKDHHKNSSWWSRCFHSHNVKD